VLTGSTRLKAGTAQKLICNMLTTGAMARLGYVYGNLMVNLHLKNEKLIERGISIVQRVAKVNRTVALATLEAADMKVSIALVMLCARSPSQRPTAASSALKAVFARQLKPSRSQLAHREMKNRGIGSAY